MYFDYKNKLISFSWAPYPGLFLEMGELLNYFCFKLGPQIVSFFKVDFPLLPSQSIVLKASCPLIFFFAAGLVEVVFDLFLNCVSKGEVLHQQILVHWDFFQDLLHLRLIQKINLCTFGSNVVNFIDLLLQFGQLSFALHHEHDFQAVLLGWGQKNQAPKIADVLCIVGEVGVEFEVEVYIEILSTNYTESISELFLKEDQQPRTVLLPIRSLQMNQHLDSTDEQDYSFIFIEPPLQLLLKKSINFHIRNLYLIYKFNANFNWCQQLVSNYSMPFLDNTKIEQRQIEKR